MASLANADFVRIHKNLCIISDPSAVIGVRATWQNLVVARKEALNSIRDTLLPYTQNIPCLIHNLAEKRVTTCVPIRIASEVIESRHENSPFHKSQYDDGICWRCLSDMLESPSPSDSLKTLIELAQTTDYPSNQCSFSSESLIWDPVSCMYVKKTQSPQYLSDDVIISNEDTPSSISVKIVEPLRQTDDDEDAYFPGPYDSNEDQDWEDHHIREMTWRLETFEAFQAKTQKSQSPGRRGSSSSLSEGYYGYAGGH
uniref:Protein 4 n=1 Tax=Chamaemelum virus 1 TaxID=2977963 RepID=A0A9N6YJ11_9RHAB|nr:TPA_asm: protein 4 [Chamaemelum virus 1]